MSEKAVVIRTATPRDATRIAELSDVLGYAADPPTFAERLQRLHGRGDDRVFVAEIESKVVGWAHAAEQEPLEYGRRCEILGLVVDPAFRSQGVGRALVRAVEQWAVSRHLGQVCVRSNVTRTESHPFYERLGYVRAKTQHAYRKPLVEGPLPPHCSPA